MSFELILFYAFSAVLLVSAATMVTVRNPVYAALCLILCFFTSAAMWIMLEAEFLGIVLVLVYVGAVMVLFLFVIMMLDVKQESTRNSVGKYWPFGLAVAATIALEMIFVLNRGYFSDPEKYISQRHDADYSNTEALGELLYTKFLYPFEIAGVILLVAIIVAIVLTLRRRPGMKSQDIGQQVRVRKQDRLRVVKMEVEK